MSWLTRMAAMALKELKVVLLDKRARTTLILSPILQLALFGLATTLEVKNIDIGVVNRDAGIASERFIATLGGSMQARVLGGFSGAGGDLGKGWRRQQRCERANNAQS